MSARVSSISVQDIDEVAELTTEVEVRLYQDGVSLVVDGDTVVDLTVEAAQLVASAIYDLTMGNQS